MSTPQESKTGSVTVGTERDMQGNFSGVVKLKIDEGFRLGEVAERLGRFNVFAGDLEIKYSPVTEWQAKLALNYLHWKLPQLGPMLGEVVLRGAYNYAQNTLSVTEGLEARVKSTYVKGLQLRVGFDWRVDIKNNVATQGVITNIAAVYTF